MSLDAGKLRDVLRIQQRGPVQDPETGAMVVMWSDQITNVPAYIEDLSQRDQIASQAMNSNVTARITIRYLPGLTSQHRLVDNEGTIYTLEGPPIRDKDTRREFMTLSVSVSIANGE